MHFRNLPRKKRGVDGNSTEEEDDLKPNFLVVQEEILRIILLLDISSSMESNMNQLYQAVVGYELSSSPVTQ